METQRQGRTEERYKLYHGWLTMPNVCQGAELTGIVMGGVAFRNPDKQTGRVKKILFYLDTQAASDPNPVRQTRIEGPEKLVTISRDQLEEMKSPMLVIREGRPSNEDCDVLKSEKFDARVNRLGSKAA